jgi:hypothetical protein
MPDPSDYRSGDELNPRSPYYDGDDDEDGTIDSDETHEEQTDDGPMSVRVITGSESAVNAIYQDMAKDKTIDIYDNPVERSKYAGQAKSPDWDPSDEYITMTIYYGPKGS